MSATTSHRRASVVAGGRFERDRAAAGTAAQFNGWGQTPSGSDPFRPERKPARSATDAEANSCGRGRAPRRHDAKRVLHPGESAAFAGSYATSTLMTLVEPGMFTAVPAVI